MCSTPSPALPSTAHPAPAHAPGRPPWAWLLGLLLWLACLSLARAHDGVARIERIDTAVAARHDTAGPPREGWQPLAGHTYLAGYSRQTHWLRLEIVVEQPGSLVLAVLPAFLDRVDLWLPPTLAGLPAEAVPGTRHGLLVQHQGDHASARTGDWLWRGSSFRLEARETGRATLYLQVSSSSSVMVQPSLMAPRDFADRVIRESLLIGLMAGIMAILGVYATLHWWAEREPVVALHATFAATSIFYLVNYTGLWATYVLPDQAMDGIEWLGLSVAIQNFCGGWLVVEALGLRRLNRPVDRFVRTTLWLYPLFAAFALAGQWALVARWTVGLLGMQLLVVAACLVLTWRRRDSMPPLTATAYLLVILSFLMPLGALLGLRLPDWMLMYAAQVSNTALLLLMVPMVTHRMRQIRMARDRAELEAHRAALVAQRHAQELQLQEETARGRREWLAMMAHEIKTPLAVIEASNHNIRAIAMDENVLARSAKIARGTRQLKALIATMLLEDVEGLRHRDPDYTEVHPAAIVRTLLAELAAEERQRIGFSLDESVRVQADPLLLQIAVNNLLLNALRHSGQASRIRLSVTREAPTGGEPEGAMIRVHDDGPTLPPERQATLFERKGRFGHLAGSGIGLWACRQIATAHQGVLRWLAPTDAPRGNIFELWIPQQRE